MNATCRLLFLIAALCTAGCNLHESKDYEECEAQAAKDAKTNQALGILVSKCALDFPARRRPDGIYLYHDSFSGQYYQVKGPIPTKEEWGFIEEDRRKKSEEHDKYLSDTKNRKSEAIKSISVISAKATCVFNASCMEKVITATIENNSKYNVTGVHVGWVFSSEKIECTKSMARSDSTLINIPPGEHAVLSWNTRDGPSNFSNICIEVVDVDVE